MKTLRLSLLLILTLFLSARADEARFFRISGPVTSTITAFSADGYLTWTNAQTNATFTVQTAISLSGASNWVDFVQIPTNNSVNTHRLFDPAAPASTALIPAGSFTMGDILGDGSSSELPLHIVYVSAFYMDRYEVTKALWDEVYQWATNHGYSFEYEAQGKANNHPAHAMTWYHAAKWCNARSEKEGRLPAYYTSTEQTVVYRNGQIDVQNDWVKWNAGYRLPTEAEWEKAARGGVSGQRFPWGNTINQSQANYQSYWIGGVPNFSFDVNSTSGYHPMFNDAVLPYTSPVGYFAPNGYGLFDMAGNVWEWCWDWHGTYSGSSQTDPRGPVSSSYRVIRSSAYDVNAFSCRTADRYINDPAFANFGLGFRCVLPAAP